MNCSPLRIERVAILSTGSEILQGLYADTNAQWLAAQFSSLGVTTVLTAAAPDHAQELEALLRYACSRADLVVCSGGLGPTADDVNREVFAQVYGVPLERDEQAVEMMRARFARRGRTMPESNLVQAMVPQGAAVLYNEWGTAPGFLLLPRPTPASSEFSQAPRAALLALPGPPRELKPMFRERALPLLEPYLAHSRFVLTRTLHTFGAPESELGESVRDLFHRDERLIYTMLAKPHGVDIRITARASTREEAEALVQEYEALTRQRIGERLIYGSDDETLPLVLARMLTHQHLTLACAESCTGGLVAKLMTDIPGSSAYFREGLVTYANEAKVARLGVSPSTLERYGAVSEETAREMLEGLLARTNAQVATAITGIAGPTGGSADKPVGLTYIAIATPRRKEVHRAVFAGDREFNRNFAALTALNLLRIALLQDHD